MEAEAAFERRSGLLLLRVCGDQRGVDIQHHNLEWPGTKPRRLNAADKRSVRPTRSASSRTATDPASGTRMLQDLPGIVKGTSYIESPNCWITTSASTWGWIHLVGGIISLAAGFGVFSGAAWPRWLGILIATISVFVDVTFIPFEPWWALTIIFIDLWVIHSLFVHRRLRD